MTKILLLDYKDMIDGKYDAQIPTDWKYCSLHSLYRGWCMYDFRLVAFPIAFVRRGVPFPKSVRVRYVDTQDKYYFDMDYTDLVAVTIAFDLTSLPSVAALRDYLLHGAQTGQWTKMYSSDGLTLHPLDEVKIRYDPNTHLDERKLAPYARLTNHVFATKMSKRPPRKFSP